MTQSVTDDLIALIVREMKLTGPAPLPTTPFFEGGLELDSFAVVDLVSRIESHFGFHLDDADFKPENFTDIATLAGVVARYTAAKA